MGQARRHHKGVTNYDINDDDWKTFTKNTMAECPEIALFFTFFVYIISVYLV